MQTPSFFNDAPTIEMIDPLANFLGAVTDGHITYSYVDAVKLAGHSCPTVAGAYLMTKLALAHLYGEETPVRGNIQVEMSDAVDDGVTGVIGNVIGLMTGAAGSGGFKGIGGKFNRAGLLKFGSGKSHTVQFTRMDNEQTIGASFDASAVPPGAEQMPMMQKLMSGGGSPEDVVKFGKLWQTRVATIMTSPELWERMVVLG